MWTPQGVVAVILGSSFAAFMMAVLMGRMLYPEFVMPEYAAQILADIMKTLLGGLLTYLGSNLPKVNK